MIELNELVEYVQKTNPSMDRKRLIEELSKCKYSTAALLLVWNNSKATS